MPGTSLQFNTGARIHEGGARRCWWQLVVARGGSVEVGGRKERGASGADGDGWVEAVVFGVAFGVSSQARALQTLTESREGGSDGRRGSERRVTRGEEEEEEEEEEERQWLNIPRGRAAEVATVVSRKPSLETKAYH
ncbi:hypothetical protein V1478_003030 [Vespula squamosa]|uniref:Uncharacterized protein n=1 Tax=Vespula squamosa TaxID=30214 RepID=A0ABD2BRT6_VESSQ